MLKTIPEREFDSLREVLPNYYQMMKQNPDSLISRFYGLHRVIWTDAHSKRQERFLVVMNNVFKDFKVGIRFDLKGSTAGRDQLQDGELPYEQKRDKKVAMKDNDFTKHFKYLTFIDNSDEQ